MKYTEQHKAEALQILEACSPEQWQHLCNFVNLITHKPTPEEQQKQEARERKEQEEREQRRAEREAEETDFIAWKKKRLGSFTAPEGRYDIGSNDLETLVQYLCFHGLQTERALSAVCAVYDYGFKRGLNFLKAQTKKKAALHAANMKNGLECSTSEI